MTLWQLWKCLICTRSAACQTRRTLSRPPWAFVLCSSPLPHTAHTFLGPETKLISCTDRAKLRFRPQGRLCAKPRLPITFGIPVDNSLKALNKKGILSRMFVGQTFCCCCCATCSFDLDIAVLGGCLAAPFLFFQGSLACALPSPRGRSSVRG